MKPGADINTLQAQGDIVSINQLINLLILHLPDSNMAISELKALMPEVTLKCSFATWGGYPKNLFSYITSQIDKGRNLEMDILHDGPGKEVNERYVYSKGKWNFDQSQPSIHVLDNKGTCYTSGAHILPFSYANREGKVRYAWMVASFVDGVYRHGEDIQAIENAPFLEGLTPPELDEVRSDEFIIQHLQARGLQRFSEGYYRTKLDEHNAFVYIHHKVENIDNAEKISRTLGEYLLRSPLFCGLTREILVDAFGRDREDIALWQGKYLVIGTGKLENWIIEERRLDETQKSINP